MHSPISRFSLDIYTDSHFPPLQGKAKHDAWGKVSDVSVEEAQEKYIELFEKLKAKYGLTEKEEK